MRAGEGRAAALAIGDELLDGSQVDLNSPTLARLLGEHGWQVGRVVCVGDSTEQICSALEELCSCHDLVVISGGLGPTRDDLTRHGVAEAAGTGLAPNDEAMSQIRTWYEASGRPMPASNERQALIPVGARVLLNSWGSAPGFQVDLHGCPVFAFPGPPREFQPMLSEHLEPWLASLDSKRVRLVQRFYLFNLSESVFADRVGAWMQRGANPLMGVTAVDGILAVRLVAEGLQASEVQSTLDVRSAEFREQFGEHIFSEAEPCLAQVLGQLLLDRGLKLSTAESCTGGAVAQAITGVAGISSAFEQGWVTYSNEAKVEQLGLDPALIAEHGAVSGPVARAMARLAAERSGAALALSTTGIAGPGGGSPDKPVGLVWLGVHFEGRTVSLERRWPPAGRERIRAWATAQALSMAWKTLMGRPLE